MGTRPSTGSLRLPVAAFRGALLALCLLLAVVGDGVNTAALGRLMVLALVGGVISVAMWRGTPAVGGALLEALIVGAFVPASGGATSPLLPYLLAPGLALGLAGGWAAAVGGGAAATVGAMVVRLASYPGLDLREYAVATGQWVALSVAVGVVAAGARAVSAPGGPVDRYAEAHALLQQLRAVSARLPGGLDAPSAASALLERCSELAPVTRSAVLVQRGGGDQLVPIAVHGTRRVPWRAPLTAPGPLQRAWDERRPLVDVRKPDRAGRRRGSALAVVPLITGDDPYGLVVLESLQPDTFADEALAGIVATTTEAALQIETALLFEEVRATATLEERDRLARQMHDGMAQDIAFLGYQLDALRMRAAKDPELDAGIVEVRSQLTSLISDIRLSITDLRTTVDTERGLGGAITNYVRAIGAGRDLRVHLSLQESTFRLPGDSEVVLFRVVQAMAQDLRRSRRAGQLWVTLTTDPPSAALVVEHDGPLRTLDELDLADQRDAVERAGGSLRVRAGRSGGPLVVVELGGDEGVGRRPAGR